MSVAENQAIDALSLSTHAGVMRVGFNRPSHKNAITGAMYLELARAFEAAEADQAVRVVVLHGSDDTFTAGNDIGDFLAHQSEPGELPSALFMKTMLRSTKPIIAAVNGPAVGIGATMLLHCDLVYVGATAKLVFPFAKLGLCPEFASTVLLPAVVGHQRASRLLLLGDSCSADEACRLGLANEVLPPTEVLPHAMSVAAKLAQMSPAAIQGTKSLIRSGQVTILEQQIDEEGAMFRRLLGSPEAKAAFEDFVRKKKP
jgi:enoyl-CoA hydratase/carnithine racemase